jgi:hypothetical protein
MSIITVGVYGLSTAYFIRRRMYNNAKIQSVLEHRQKYFQLKLIWLQYTRMLELGFNHNLEKTVQ